MDFQLVAIFLLADSVVSYGVRVVEDWNRLERASGIDNGTTPILKPLLQPFILGFSAEFSRQRFLNFFLNFNRVGLSFMGGFISIFKLEIH